MVQVLNYARADPHAHERRRDRVLAGIVLSIAVAAATGICLPLIRVIVNGLL